MGAPYSIIGKDAPKISLTDTAIRGAKPSAKPIRLFNGFGLYVEVSPAGGKLWRLKYRFDGKEMRLALGIYPEVALKDARQRRDEARKLLADGIDPGKYRKATKTMRVALATNTFEVIAHGDRNKVSAAYNFAEYLPERRAMMQQWADYLGELKAGAEVIPLRGTA